MELSKLMFQFYSLVFVWAETAFQICSASMTRQKLKVYLSDWPSTCPKRSLVCSTTVHLHSCANTCYAFAVSCQPMLSNSFPEISAKFSRSLDIFGVIIFCWPVFTWCSPFATLLCPSKSKGSRWGGVTQQKLMQRQQQFSNNESSLKQQWNGDETTTLKRQWIKESRRQLLPSMVMVNLPTWKP